MREEALPCLQGHGLSPLDPWMLVTLQHHPYPSEMVEITGMPAPTISQNLKRLEGAGFIERRSDPTDLRRYRFELTPQGLQRLEDGQRCFVAIMKQRLEALNPSERNLLLQLLERVASDPSPERI